ncbi:MAG: alpha-glucosidase C-terminal domain-containing protein [Oscillospiraceae bacterium]|nr:alpha-glucosidase C-terminal domain-containing protein [Oscillospiraceae bacterium]
MLAFLRQSADDRCLTVLNAGDTPVTLSLPWDGELATDTLTSQQFLPQNGMLRLTLGARDGLLLV